MVLNPTMAPGIILSSLVTRLDTAEASSSVDEPATVHSDEVSKCYEDILQKRMEICQTSLSSSAAFGLEECWTWKPILDGKQVMTLLGITRAGPELGPAVSAVMEWQLAHPGGDVQDCQKYILENFGPGSK